MVGSPAVLCLFSYAVFGRAQGQVGAPKGFQSRKTVKGRGWGGGLSFDCEPPAAPGGTAIPGPRPDMVQAPEARLGINIRLINWMVYDHRIRD